MATITLNLKAKTTKAEDDEANRLLAAALPDLRSDETKYNDNRVHKAIAAERERCAKIAEQWLTDFGNFKPTLVDAQTWAVDAVADIADAIRRGD